MSISGVKIKRKKKFVIENGQATEAAHKPKPPAKPKAGRSGKNKAKKAAPQPAPQKPKKPVPPPLSRHEKDQARIRKNRRKMEPLQQHWPKLFDMDHPKPLAIGIYQVLDATGLMKRSTLKETLALYTGRYRYFKALAAGGSRYDIEGREAGVVTPEQQQAAAERLVRKKRKSTDSVLPEVLCVMRFDGEQDRTRE